MRCDTQIIKVVWGEIAVPGSERTSAIEWTRHADSGTATLCPVVRTEVPVSLLSFAYNVRFILCLIKLSICKFCVFLINKSQIWQNLFHKLSWSDIFIRHSHLFPYLSSLFKGITPYILRYAMDVSTVCSNNGCLY